MRKFYNIALSIAPLIIGGMLYLGYRSQELLMFRWANFLGLSCFVSSWRKICFQHPLPEWCYYALPDGLWLLSYILLIDLIWQGNNYQYRVWVYVLQVIAIASEFMQLLIPYIGTFDIMDVGCYLGAILLFEVKTRIEWKRKGF